MDEDKGQRLASLRRTALGFNAASALKKVDLIGNYLYSNRLSLRQREVSSGSGDQVQVAAF